MFRDKLYKSSNCPENRCVLSWIEGVRIRCTLPWRPCRAQGWGVGSQGRGVRVRQCPRLTPRLAAQCQPQSSSAEKHEAGISDPSQTRTHTESFSLATEAKRRTRWFTERRPGASRTFKQSSPGILIPLPLATKDRRGARSRALDVCAQERRTQWPRMNGKGQGTPVLQKEVITKNGSGPPRWR